MAPTAQAQTEQFTIQKRWSSPALNRRAARRAVASVRARVAHTSAQKRRLDIFISEPVLAQVEWRLGGSVEVHFDTSHGFTVRIRPGHGRLHLARAYPKSGTARVAVSGAPLKPAMCAGAREVTYRIEDGAIFVDLPVEWSAVAQVEAA